MKKSKKGFTLVEVMVAIAVIAIISAVTITLVATSGDMLNEADDVVWASAEARNIADCYAKSKISDGESEDTFVERVGVIHGKADMAGFFKKSGDPVVYEFYFDVDSESREEYIDYVMVTAPANDGDGGYKFRVEMTVENDNMKSLEIIRFKDNKSIYTYHPEA